MAAAAVLAAKVPWTTFTTLPDAFKEGKWICPKGLSHIYGVPVAVLSRDDVGRLKPMAIFLRVINGSLASKGQELATYKALGGDTEVSFSYYAPSGSTHGDLTVTLTNPLMFTSRFQDLTFSTAEELSAGLSAGIHLEKGQRMVVRLPTTEGLPSLEDGGAFLAAAFHRLGLAVSGHFAFIPPGSTYSIGKGPTFISITALDDPVTVRLYPS